MNTDGSRQRNLTRNPAGSTTRSPGRPRRNRSRLINL